MYTRNVKLITMKVIFYRYNKFDNSKCKRKFPYEGKSWFVIKSRHLKRLIYFIVNSKMDDEVTEANNLDNWEFVDMKDMVGNEISVLDYQKINDYVMGTSDVLPGLEEFIPSIHTAKWRKSKMFHMGYSKYEHESRGIPYWIPVNNYQVLIK